ncbi:hypothetical protein AVEN_9143-1 [Araneus ventricosus]|uniref:Uncharacterized protein n=1 Tax=Araneus ventricosus TaxID=182803 RepID=A0A4Y2RS77_ARAVE|nr:hypothetical protein AVEN_96850-1 [Araneus ventricosus]GBN78684.1 hypothetical protein AVEN_119155-1 [Araneus ventricosus]GBN79530.1 hypothetical protein AVEN_184140-1 [Araneus ventricosus]GBN79535.1 hypothetical protein AVEN_9143-1 [Araneus ventricosus]
MEHEKRKNTVETLRERVRRNVLGKDNPWAGNKYKSTGLPVESVTLNFKDDRDFSQARILTEYCSNEVLIRIGPKIYAKHSTDASENNLE